MKLTGWELLCHEFILLKKRFEAWVKPPAIKIKRTRGGATIPGFMSAGAAGADVYACLDQRSPASLAIRPGETAVVPLGFAMELPPGYEMQVRSRSGLTKRGIVVANSPGTIDEDFRGENGVLLRNDSGGDYVVKHGDRVAQFVLARAVRPTFEEVEELSETERGAGSFGSTGQ